MANKNVVVDEETAKQIVRNKLDLIQEILNLETLATNIETANEVGKKQNMSNPHKDPEAQKAIELQISLNQEAARSLRNNAVLKKDILLGKLVSKEEEQNAQKRLDKVALQIGQSIRNSFINHPDVMHPETRVDVEAELKDPKSALNIFTK